jgi:hypothetical protein
LDTFQEILHVKARGLTVTPLRALFHDQLARIAFVCLEPFVAHRRPTVAAVKEIANTDVERIARLTHLRRRRSANVADPFVVQVRNRMWSLRVAPERHSESSPTAQRLGPHRATCGCTCLKKAPLARSSITILGHQSIPKFAARAKSLPIIGDVRGIKRVCARQSLRRRLHVRSIVPQRITSGLTTRLAQSKRDQIRRPWPSRNTPGHAASPQQFAVAWHCSSANCRMGRALGDRRISIPSFRIL